MTAPSVSTVSQWLTLARQWGVDRLDAQLLVAHAMGQPRSWVLAHGEALPTDAQSQACSALLQRRAQGWPLSYLTGHREFYGLRLRITPEVLDPRPDTETLVEWALECLRDGPIAQRSRPRVLDLGTGSGAIALAIQVQCPHAEVHATDASPGALTVARSNAQELGLHVQFHQGSWWAAAPAGRFDLVVSNPPYLAKDDPHLPALSWEPMQALTADDAGMADLRTIAMGATARLSSGGALLLEHGFEQAGLVASCLATAGLSDIGHRSDLGGHTRCTGGWHAG